MKTHNYNGDHAVLSHAAVLRRIGRKQALLNNTLGRERAYFAAYHHPTFRVRQSQAVSEGVQRVSTSSCSYCAVLRSAAQMPSSACLPHF
jgi:hypothetical protein